MKASNSLWKEKLAGRLAGAEPLSREIDAFETDIALRKQGKLDERLFAETRLRRGAYGQRYDNGQRSDGQKVQRLNFPSGDLTKGPMTMWDAPWMQRIKIPGGVWSYLACTNASAWVGVKSGADLHPTPTNPKPAIARTPKVFQSSMILTLPPMRTRIGSTLTTRHFSLTFGRCQWIRM